MNKELQKYYEARFSTMATQGWLDLMDDVDKMIKSTDSIQGIDDIKKLHFRQGELNMLNWLSSLKKVSEQSYEELNREGVE